MRTFRFLDELEKLRIRIKAPKFDGRIDQPLSEFQIIERELRTKGKKVNPEDIQRVGPYLAYKDNNQELHLAILYIQNYNTTREALENNKPTSGRETPKFHLTWCKAIEGVYNKRRFEKYVLSQSESNMFDVEVRDSRNEDFVNARLYPCQFCLGQLKYRGFDYDSLKYNPKLRYKIVEEFNVKDFLAENYGTLVTWKHLPKSHANIQRRGQYTKTFPELSRSLREAVGWVCSTCRVNMNNMKEGLHTHHINGVKSDNSSRNLQVLCALCHKNVDEYHSHMTVRPEIEHYIREHRPIDTGY